MSGTFLNAINAYNNALDIAKQAAVTKPTETENISSGKVANSGFSNLVQNVVETTQAPIYKGEASTINAFENNSSLVDVATFVSSAEITLQTVVAVRDKIIAAYQDIIKMPI